MAHSLPTKPQMWGVGGGEDVGVEKAGNGELSHSH